MSSTKAYNVGIGITTYNRPDMLRKCLESIIRYTCMENVLCVISEDTDEDRRGVAYRKNCCLRALKDCDYIFLFDDDCYPIKCGWIEYFVTAAATQHQEHLLFLNKKIHNYKYSKTIPYGAYFTIDYYKDCGGVFMFLTKQVLNRVGSFNETFDIYGFEHAEYSMRILGKHGEYPMLKHTEEYLYSEDYSNPNHKSSISDEEKNKHIKNNWNKFFNKEIKSIHLPL